jgi:hypothetical protein
MKRAIIEAVLKSSASFYIFIGCFDSLPEKK